MSARSVDGTKTPIGTITTNGRQLYFSMDNNGVLNAWNDSTKLTIAVVFLIILPIPKLKLLES